jgi:2-oxoacid:acceptor oxidoreductase gamma subunit (pyruvate/2-ketoisovalerate family)
MLATALVQEGKYALAFPRFTGERRGGAVAAFVRVGDPPSEVPRCQIYEPDCLILMHPSLLNTREGEEIPEVLQGFKEGGLIVINSSRDPDEFDSPIHCTIATVNATGIAEKHGLGTVTSRPVNTAILGALVRATELVSFASLETAILKEVPAKPTENLAAAHDAFESVKILKEVSHA